MHASDRLFFLGNSPFLELCLVQKRSNVQSPATMWPNQELKIVPVRCCQMASLTGVCHPHLIPKCMFLKCSLTRKCRTFRAILWIVQSHGSPLSDHRDSGYSTHESTYMRTENRNQPVQTKLFDHRCGGAILRSDETAWGMSGSGIFGHCNRVKL